MRARGKRSSCAPTPPANPIPIASVERGRGRGKGRREEERGGRRHTWNLAPARRMQLPPRESGPSASHLCERDSVASVTPALPATDSRSVRRDPRAAPRPTAAPSPTATLLCERAIGSYVLPSSFLCCSVALLLLPLLPPALPPPSSSALPLPRSHALLLPVLYFAFSALLVSPIYELQFDSWNGYTY